MINKKFFFGGCVLIFSYLLISSCIFAGDSSKELMFGPVISDIKGMGVSSSKFADDYATIRKGTQNTKTLHFSVDTGKASLHRMSKYDYVKVEDLKPYGSKPGEPQLPFKSFVVNLPVKSKVLGVEVSNVAYRPILNKLNIAPTPKPVKWSEADSKEPSISGNFNCKTCNSESFFPGNLVSYHTGKDNSTRYVFVKFFPMQYIPKSKEAILVTNATIKVNYQLVGDN